MKLNLTLPMKPGAICTAIFPDQRTWRTVSVLFDLFLLSIGACQYILALTITLSENDNIYIKRFPICLVTGILGYKIKPLFKISEEMRNNKKWMDE